LIEAGAEDPLRLKREYAMERGIKCTFLVEAERTARYKGS